MGSSSPGPIPRCRFKEGIRILQGLNPEYKNARIYLVGVENSLWTHHFFLAETLNSIKDTEWIVYEWVKDDNLYYGNFNAYFLSEPQNMHVHLNLGIKEIYIFHDLCIKNSKKVYNAITNNCNHWAERIATEILGKKIELKKNCDCINEKNNILSFKRRLNTCEIKKISHMTKDKNKIIKKKRRKSMPRGKVEINLLKIIPTIKIKSLRSKSVPIECKKYKRKYIRTHI